MMGLDSCRVSTLTKSTRPGDKVMVARQRRCWEEIVDEVVKCPLFFLRNGRDLKRSGARHETTSSPVGGCHQQGLMVSATRFRPITH